MLFTGLGRAVLGKAVPSQVRPSACGLGPYSRPRAQFFPIRSSRPVNNIYLLHIMCGYQCDKAVNKNDTREVI